MQTVKMHTAKTMLSRLVAQVEAGEEVVILRGNTPVAKIVPIVPAPPQRSPGRLKDRIALDDSFFDPLPDEEIDAWEGR